VDGEQYSICLPTDANVEMFITKSNMI
jgi:hypothetical protein